MTNKLIEINKTIDYGHRNLEAGTTSKVESVRAASKALFLSI